MRVVLPAPFAPSRPTISPGRTWMLTSRTAVTVTENAADGDALGQVRVRGHPVAALRRDSRGEPVWLVRGRRWAASSADGRVGAAAPLSRRRGRAPRR